MKQEEEEHNAFLSSLGVTSANPEDIERDVLQQARSNAGGNSESGGTVDHKAIDTTENTDTISSLRHVELYNKLRAVNIEIDAVASTVEQIDFVKSDDHASDEVTGKEQSSSNPWSSDPIQQALASDRLRSLKKTQIQLEDELIKCKGKSADGNNYEKLLQDVVQEEPKRKRKEDPKLSGNQKKRRKAVTFGDDDDFDSVLNAASVGFVETERDELVRKGILTPFHKLKGFERRIQETGPSSKKYLPGDVDNTDDFASSSIARAARSISQAAEARPTTKLLDPEYLPKLDAATRPFQRLRAPPRIPQSLRNAPEIDKDLRRKKKRPSPGKKWKKGTSREVSNLEEIEDLRTSSNEEDNQESVDDEPSFVTLEGGLNIPETIFTKLFDYQKVGVQWLWELHCQKVGGIIGDEMGLGKTIQVLAFLGALHSSNLYKPSIIVCPVTLLRQWKREAQKWYPAFHVEILHDSAHDSSTRKKPVESDESDYESESEVRVNSSRRNNKKWDTLISRVLKSDSGLLITTYEQLRLLGEKLLDIGWGYAVLDEGHRIRNPNAEVTLVCKQLHTVHRIIMTGAPIQNKLSELWSLFDFVFPGKLGVLPIFEAEFAVPISVGGYANASPLQVSTAYRCAVVLRDLIVPYLLRRMKADVNAQLTKKTEHVLFCSLTSEQRSVYRAFLASAEVEQIFNGNRNSLYGIDVMRKICNHPDLLEREHSYGNPDYGNPERSGKMKVVAEVLKVWKQQGHRVLLFAQTQQMLDILESFLIACCYTYRRMDGITPVRQRMTLIDEFNNSDEVFIFILTTKVGGLGTNLTGANRVIIFDPDWNPSTDMQARERAWRIGQTKDVTVFRLITRGTIEEKVYHRQIYKHFLTNKILKNPQQKRFFKSRDMKDLFILTDDGEHGFTETSSIFSQLAEDVNVVGTHKNNDDNANVNKPTASNLSNDASEIGNDSNIKLSNKGKEKAENSGKETDEESNILQSLFDAHGIHSAVNHDLIMNANDGEKLKLEEQASQVAQRAAEALRQSRVIRSRESIAVPTWTGKSGAAGAPSSVRQKFGSTVNTQLVGSSRPSEGLLNSEGRKLSLSAGAANGKALTSSELLARIRGNQERAAGDGIEQQFGQASSSTGRANFGNNSAVKSSNLSGVQPEVLIRQICTFLQQRGGRTVSASIVQHFKDRIPSKDLPLFKNLLKEIATLEKNPSGSSWVLKPEYKEE
ncbi:protein CHROMATIN REMODELING 8 [Apium graveolens]|uniref:protein CHROMATIN REMODELING 8 n=1 Tax=Apium graveolens TaxID=4045 RepID=UPI003D7B4B89